MNKEHQQKGISSSLSVNERLFEAGCLGKYEAAARLGDRKRMVAMLKRIGLSTGRAAQWVDTQMEGDSFLRSWYK